MKLLGNTENKITKDKNCEDVPHLETTEVLVVLVVLQYQFSVILLRNTENKIAKNKKDENVPHLEITEVLVVLVVLQYQFIVILSIMIISKI